MITIEKAIETLSDILRYVKPGDPPEEHDAIRLGIEALKYVQDIRYIVNTPNPDLLPSENQE